MTYDFTECEQCGRQIPSDEQTCRYCSADQTAAVRTDGGHDRETVTCPDENCERDADFYPKVIANDWAVCPEHGAVPMDAELANRLDGDGQ